MKTQIAIVLTLALAVSAFADDVRVRRMRMQISTLLIARSITCNCSSKVDCICEPGTCTCENCKVRNIEAPRTQVNQRSPAIRYQYPTYYVPQQYFANPYQFGGSVCVGGT